MLIFMSASGGSMGFMEQVTTTIKSIMDVFGSVLIVPIIVLILSLAIGVDKKKAMQASINMAIGLTSFGMILGILMGQIGGAVNQMVENTGVSLQILDIGWPAASTIVYSNNLGMLYLIVGLVWNLILFFTKVTDTFQPTDIWNYYYFIVWSIMVEFVTGSFMLGLFTALFMNLIVLLIADVLAPSLQEYYGYDGLTCTCICVTNISILAVIMRMIIKKFKFKEIQLNTEKLQEKFGFWGEPVAIGLILGFFIAILANIKNLGELSAWATIVKTALTLAGIMVLYPTVSGLFVKGLIPVSQHMNAKLRSGSMKREVFNIGIDPAVYFGETSTLTTGLVLIPILIFTAIIMPGANIMPLADIPAMPFMAIGMISVFGGNIFNAIICGTIWYTIAHYCATDTAVLFTQAAIKAGVNVEAGSLIHSWCVAAQPPLYAIFKLFSLEGSMKYIAMVVCVVVYVLILAHFKKNRKKWFMAFGASEEFVDKYLAHR